MAKKNKPQRQDVEKRNDRDNFWTLWWRPIVTSVLVVILGQVIVYFFIDGYMRVETKEFSQTELEKNKWSIECPITVTNIGLKKLKEEIFTIQLGEKYKIKDIIIPKGYAVICKQIEGGKNHNFVTYEINKLPGWTSFDIGVKFEKYSKLSKRSCPCKTYEGGTK